MATLDDKRTYYAATTGIAEGTPIRDLEAAYFHQKAGGEPVLIMHANGTQTGYTPTADTAAARGTALATAAAAAVVSGDVIHLSDNTYELSSALTLAAGVRLVGNATFTGAYASTGYKALRLVGDSGLGLLPIAGPRPNEIPSPYGDRALIAVVCDDAKLDVLTSGAGGCTGMTPAEYARRNGVPLTINVIPSFVVRIPNFHFNADTDWTKGAGWTIGSGVATRTAQAAESTLAPAVAIPATIGTTYKVTYTLTRSAGSLTASFGGANGTTRSAAGTFTETIVAVSTASLVFTASADFAGTIDNVGINDSVHLSQLDIEKLAFEFGAEISNGSLTHAASGGATQPTTYAIARSEIIGGKEAVEAITDPAIKTRGFVIPGSWEGDGLLNTVAKTDNYVARLIRENHEWSVAYLNEGAFAHKKRHFSIGTAPSATWSAQELVDMGMDCAGKGVIVLMDGLPTTAGYSFKHLIDAIATARTAGTHEAVTLSTFFDAQPWTSGTAGDIGKLNYVPGGSFDSWADVTWIGNSKAKYGAWYLNNPGANGTWSLETNGSGKCLQFAEARNAGDMYATFVVPVEPGYTYRLEFDVQRTAGADISQIYIPIQYRTPNNGAPIMATQAVLLTPAAGWTSGWVKCWTFVNPPIGAGCVHFQMYNGWSGSGDKTGTIQIDNVRFMRS